MNTVLPYNILILLFFICSLQGTPSLNIKILLQTVPLEKKHTYTFSSKNGLILTNAHEPKKKYLFPSQITLIQLQKQLIIKNRKNKSSIIRIQPVDGHISFDQNNYLGTFYIHVTNKFVEIINKLSLEDYVASVLRTEGWPGWPCETYKVFAITCRTYAIYQLQQARRKKQKYHLKPTNAHQTYFGTHSCQTIKDAVKETEGIIISFKKKPILAMFDSCCGGIVPADISNSINFKEAPYLARSYACTFCKNLKIYSWNKEYPLSVFKKKITKTVPQLKNITEITTQHDKAGVTTGITIHEKQKNFFIDGKKIYSLFPEVKSFAFNCNKKKNNIQLKGTGYGHHLGLCQWGANELVKKGWPFKKILHFYYPGTNLMKLTPKEAKNEL